MAPSSSGPGRLVLIQKIAGSTPAGVTKVKAQPQGWAFTLVATPRVTERSMFCRLGETYAEPERACFKN
jgi:hypothetical protein